MATDEKFVEHEVTQFRTPNVLSDLDARALALVGDDVWVGTATGVARLFPNANSFVGLPLDGPGPVVDFAVLAGGVAVARPDRVIVVTGSQHEVWPVGGQTVTAVAARGSSVWVGTEQGVFALSSAGTTPLPGFQGFPVRDLAVVENTLYVATPGGLRRFDLAGGVPLSTWTAPAHLPDDDVRVVAPGSDGASVVVGTALGISRLNPDGAAQMAVAGLGGLATGHVQALAEQGGKLLVGHSIGLSEVTAQGGPRHLHGSRWIPAESVTAVALASDGTRFVATPGGIARHARRRWTLAEKAAFFEAATDQYLRMGGFMSNEVFRSDPWSTSDPLFRSDNDNDGLWTQLQIAAWCFAYAVTKEPSYYQKARRSMDVMLLLIDVPGATFLSQGRQPGFIARSLVRSDEGALFDDKKDQPGWHLQEYRGQTYYWKGDTSSDEYTGHFFGIPIFYDLCAQSDEERADLRAHLDLVMSYLVDNGYELLDLDGQPTTHGKWTGLANAVDGLGPCLAAGHSNCVAAFGGEGWLNSVQILGFLLAAWHVTENDRYYQEYLELAVNQRYAEMVTPRSTTLTVTSPRFANHSDHELAALAYFTLLRYEPDAERRARYLQALRDFLVYEKPERNALHLGLSSSALEDVEAEVAAQTLREMPSDRRLWRIDNSHRQDAKLSPHLDRFDAPQFESVFPYDEIGELEWNGNLYAVTQGFDGRAMQSVWPFLLPYWALRYFRALD